MNWLLGLAEAAANWAAAKLRRDTQRDEARDAATRENQRHTQASGAAAHQASKLDHKKEKKNATTD